MREFKQKTLSGEVLDKTPHPISLHPRKKRKVKKKKKKGAE